MKNRIYTGLMFFVIVFTFSKCEKVPLTVSEFATTDATKARIKFGFMSLVNTPLPNSVTVSSGFAMALKIDGIKLNNSNGYSAVFPGGNTILTNGLGIADYLQVNPKGALSVSVLNTGSITDSINVFTGALNLDANKDYTVVVADTGSSRTMFTIPDNNLGFTDSAFVLVRLINCIPNSSNAINLVRVDSASATVVTRDTIAKNIAYKSASDFIRLPRFGVNPNLRYRVIDAITGQLLSTSAPTLNNKRMHSYFAYGYRGGVGASASAMTLIYNY
jgi:hypothetical protein